jgi:hypothetical protein
MEAMTLKMDAISDLTDFSYDFQDLDFKNITSSLNND